MASEHVATDLLGSVYEARRRQIDAHVKGRDDALKNYLLAAAALAAASQAANGTSAALIPLPLVAVGFAFSFAFHHINIGANVCFLLGEFDDAVRAANLIFPNWELATQHMRARTMLRLITVVGPAVVISASAALAFRWAISAQRVATDWLTVHMGYGLAALSFLVMMWAFFERAQMEAPYMAIAKTAAARAMLGRSAS